MLYVKSINAYALSAAVNVALCVHSALGLTVDTELCTGRLCSEDIETEVNAVEPVRSGSCYSIIPEDLFHLCELIEHVDVSVVCGEEYVEGRSACGQADLCNEEYAVIVSILLKLTVNCNSCVGLVKDKAPVAGIIGEVFPCGLCGSAVLGSRIGSCVRSRIRSCVGSRIGSCVGSRIRSYVGSRLGGGSGLCSLGGSRRLCSLGGGLGSAIIGSSLGSGRSGGSVGSLGRLCGLIAATCCERKNHCECQNYDEKLCPVFHRFDSFLKKFFYYHNTHL